MLMTTADTFEDKKTTQTLGIVQGSTVQTKHLGKDFLAGLQTIIGGEIKQYTQMLEDARKEATARMIENAKNLDADAIICVRFATSSVMDRAAELFAYGTAVKLG